MKPFITKRAIILLLFVFSLATLGNAQEKETNKEANHGKSADEIARELANPNNSLARWPWISACLIWV